MSNYRLDRTQFEAFKAEEKQSDYGYWSQQGLLDRLKAANYLISTAYCFDEENFPRLDRTLFECRKRA